jgi:molybdopterin-guanine dinucleotide biosynthesis protein A
LQAYLAGGGRRVDAWLMQLRLAQVDFSDEPECFVNVNDPTERHRVATRLSSTTVSV